MATLYSGLLTGAPSIDSEHRSLIDLLGRLMSGQSAGEPHSEPFNQILGQIGNQMIEHFADEEAILKACGMPAEHVVDHVCAHGEIIRQYTELQFDLMSGKLLTRPQVLQMIQGWVISHLFEYDLRIRPFAADQPAA